MKETTIGLAVILSLSVLCTEVHAKEKQLIAIVAHPKLKLDGIGLSELRDVFLRRKQRWSDGSAIRLLNWTARTPTRVAFDDQVLKMSPDRAAAYWIDRRIRGNGTPPRALKSARLIQAIVTRLPGFIAYVPAAQVLSRRVKVLKVNGRFPADRDYPLVLRSR